MNRREIGLFAAITALCLGLLSGCKAKEGSATTDLEDFTSQVVGAVSSRDFGSIEALILPENLAYFETTGRMNSYSEFVKSRFAGVPESESPVVELRSVEILSDKGWYPSRRLIEAIPVDGVEVLEVGVKGTVDGKDFGVGLAVGRTSDNYFLLIPDVTDLWKVENVGDKQ